MKCGACKRGIHADCYVGHTDAAGEYQGCACYCRAPRPDECLSPDAQTVAKIARAARMWDELMARKEDNA